MDRGLLQAISSTLRSKLNAKKLLKPLGVPPCARQTALNSNTKLFMKPAAFPVLRATPLLHQVRGRVRYKHESLSTEKSTRMA